MKLSSGIYIIIVIFAFILVGVWILTTSQPEESKTVFHVTLADPKLYQDGIYSNSFKISKGAYMFRFVPNGDSPEILSITLNGKNFHFFENFKLIGTSHETGISEFFTWEYKGENVIEVSEDMEIKISIDPHENILGPVSVELILY